MPACAERSEALNTVPVLRDYQVRAVELVRGAFLGGKRAVCLVLSTGAGKSWVFSEIIRLAVAKGSTVLWLVHKRQLVLQMQETLSQFGVDAGIIMSGIESDTDKQVQLATVQTFIRRINLRPAEFNRFFINADLLMIDENHRSVSPTHKKIIELYKNKRIVGCTATPCRSDGRGLGEVFDALVDAAGVKELTDNGYLAPARYYVPSKVDLSKISVKRGDYDVKQLDAKMNRPRLVGDVVENWLKHGKGRPSMVFAVNVRHSIAIRDEFRRRGITAEHLDARSTDDEREFVIGEVERGNVNVVTSVGIFTEGIDIQCVSCVSIARPTKSFGLYRQMGGRGLRPKPDGSDCIILDHGGVVEEHGYLDDPVSWSLDGTKQAWTKQRRKDRVKQPMKCSVCHYVFESGSLCPECGSPVKKFGKPVETVDAELVEAKKVKATSAEKRRYLGMLKYWVADKGHNPKMVNAKYKNRYSVWPHHSIKNVEPIPPDQEFLNRIKYEAIRWAKSQKKKSTELRRRPSESGQVYLPL